MTKTITIGSGDYRGETNEVLQRAVDDAAAAGGGVVEITAGTYRMRDALHLRSGVRVLGEPGAVLIRLPSVTSPLRDYLGYGHYEITVTEPEKFAVGMGVHLHDDHSGGFYDTVATIIGREGGLFFLDRALKNDYRPQHNGRATTIFPVVDGEEVTNAAVENLTLDGNPEETERMNGCRGGGLFLLMCQRVRVQGVEVRNYNGDGISFQQCADIFVRGCHVHDNVGHGLHPGSGSVRYVMEENHVHDNGVCGIFYCLRTTHSRCAGNRIEKNGDAGISIGERDTDHLIRGNTIRGNALQAIDFRQPLVCGGDRVVIEGNLLGPNCGGEEEHEVRLTRGLRDIHLRDNRFQPGRGRALSVGPDCARISFVGNTVAGRAQEAADVVGHAESVRTTAPDALPPVGPEALPLNGARHLHLAALPSWKEQRT